MQASRSHSATRSEQRSMESFEGGRGVGGVGILQIKQLLIINYVADAYWKPQL